MNQSSTSTARSILEDSLASHRVLRNTYMLLSATLAFSGIAAWITIANHIPYCGLLAHVIGTFGLLFATLATRNSAMGLLFVFAFTGFTGYTLGPGLQLYLQLPNGGELVLTALGITAAMFMGLSGYAIISRRDFSFLGGFLFAGLIVAILTSLAGFLLHLPSMQLAVSASIVMIMAGYVLYDTSDILHGRETNYISATVGLYLDILNLFLNLLQLLSKDD